MAELHVAQRLCFDVRFASRALAEAEQETLRHFAKQRAPRIIEATLAEFSDPQTVWRLERLDLDLGAVCRDELQQCWEQRLREQLRLALAACLASDAGLQYAARRAARDAPVAELARAGRSTLAREAARAEDEPARPQVQLRHAAALRELCHFLDRGWLPWSSDTGQQGLLATLVRGSVRHHGVALSHYLGQAPHRLRRLLQQCDSTLLAELAAVPVAEVHAALSRAAGASHVTTTELESRGEPIRGSVPSLPIVRQHLLREHFTGAIESADFATCAQLIPSLLAHDGIWLRTQLDGAAVHARVRRGLVRAMDGAALRALCELWLGPAQCHEIWRVLRHPALQALTTPQRWHEHFWSAMLLGSAAERSVPTLLLMTLEYAARERAQCAQELAGELLEGLQQHPRADAAEALLQSLLAAGVHEDIGDRALAGAPVESRAAVLIDGSSRARLVVNFSPTVSSTGRKQVELAAALGELAPDEAALAVMTGAHLGDQVRSEPVPQPADQKQPAELTLPVAQEQASRRLHSSIHAVRRALARLELLTLLGGGGADLPMAAWPSGWSTLAAHDAAWLRDTLLRYPAQSESLLVGFVVSHDDRALLQLTAPWFSTAHRTALLTVLQYLDGVADAYPQRHVEVALASMPSEALRSMLESWCSAAARARAAVEPATHDAQAAMHTLGLMPRAEGSERTLRPAERLPQAAGDVRHARHAAPLASVRSEPGNAAAQVVHNITSIAVRDEVTVPRPASSATTAPASALIDSLSRGPCASSLPKRSGSDRTESQQPFDTLTADGTSAPARISSFGVGSEVSGPAAADHEVGATAITTPQAPASTLPTEVPTSTEVSAPACEHTAGPTAASATPREYLDARARPLTAHVGSGASPPPTPTLTAAAAIRRQWWEQILRTLWQGTAPSAEPLAMPAQSVPSAISLEAPRPDAPDSTIRAQRRTAACTALADYFAKGSPGEVAGLTSVLLEAGGLASVLSDLTREQRRQICHALEAPTAVQRVLTLCDEPQRRRLLRMLRPHEHFGIEHTTQLLLDSWPALSSLGRQRQEQIKWGFILHECCAEDRLFRIDGLVQRLADYAASMPGVSRIDATALAARLRRGSEHEPTDASHESMPIAAAQLAAGRKLREALATMLESGSSHAVPASAPQCATPGVALGEPLAVGECMYLDNAGMVLAAPYIERLFGMLQLTHQGAFVSTEAAERAVHLLQYLVTGAAETPEYRLSLNKLLCAVPFELPLGRAIEISEQERVTIEGLLAAMIQHWRSLGSTSVAGLRESFLRREGRLTRHVDHWRLLVEPRAFDVLLDRLPWSYAMIKFPWMPEVLHVQWR